MPISQHEKDNATVLIPADEFHERYGHGEESDDEKEWRKFQEELSDGIEYAKMTVYRVPTNERGQPERKQMSFCFECGLQDYSFSQLCGRIQSEYGGGVYRLQVRDENGRLVKNKGISVEAPKGDEKRGNNVGEIVDSITRVQRETQMMLRQAMQPANNAPPVDPIKQMTEMMAAVGAMMGAIGLRPEPPPPPKTLLEQMQEFAMIKELMGGDNGNDNGLYSMLTETIRAFGPPLAAAISAGQNQGALDSRGVMVNKSLPQPEAQPSKEDLEKMEYDKQMKQQIGVLLLNARAGADTKKFAQLIVDNTPDDKLDALDEWLRADDFLEKLIAADPKVKDFRNWFIALRDQVIKLLDEMIDGDDEPGLTSAQPETVTGGTDSAASETDGDTPKHS